MDRKSHVLLVCCLPLLLQTEKFYDMLGTGSFAVLALGSLLKTSSMHARKVGTNRLPLCQLLLPNRVC